MTKRLLPIGLQTFATMRENGYSYVDKTARIYQLIASGVCAVFLARPQRFGKSLLCSALDAIFAGQRE
jgi:hypothetical protein